MTDLLFREDVMIGDDHDPVRIPDFRVSSEVFVEDPDRAGTADVMGHEDIDIDPDILTGATADFRACFARIFSVIVMRASGQTP